jgi:hypothetical protein
MEDDPEYPPGYEPEKADEQEEEEKEEAVDDTNMEGKKDYRKRDDEDEPGQGGTAQKKKGRTQLERRIQPSREKVPPRTTRSTPANKRSRVKENTEQETGGEEGMKQDETTNESNVNTDSEVNDMWTEEQEKELKALEKQYEIKKWTEEKIKEFNIDSEIAIWQKKGCIRNGPMHQDKPTRILNNYYYNATDIEQMFRTPSRHESEVHLSDYSDTEDAEDKEATAKERMGDIRDAEEYYREKTKEEAMKATIMRIKKERQEMQNQWRGQKQGSNIKEKPHNDLERGLKERNRGSSSYYVGGESRQAAKMMNRGHGERPGYPRNSGGEF